MPKRIIDILEIVEIEEDDRERARTAPGGREGGIEPLHKGAPIGQHGEWIGLGEFGHPLVGRQQPARVAAHDSQIGHHDAADDQTRDQHEPSLIMADRHRQCDQREPRSRARHDVARPSR
jgi:hypothetical protein